MSDVVKVKVAVSVGLVGCKRETIAEFDREDWESWDEAMREDACRDEMWEMVEWDWKEVEE